jgi:DNA polymerase V
VKTNSLVAEIERHGPLLVHSLPVSVIELGATVRAGFPSPAEDLGAKRIDLTAKLIKHPQATFLMRARGESMKEAGIFDGDVLVVDRAIQARNGHVVIAVIEGEFVCKTLSMRAGRMKLKAANPGHPDIVPKDSQIVEIWGVVIHAIKSMPA